MVTAQKHINKLLNILTACNHFTVFGVSPHSWIYRNLLSGGACDGPTIWPESLQHLSFKCKAQVKRIWLLMVPLLLTYLTLGQWSHPPYPPSCLFVNVMHILCVQRVGVGRWVSRVKRSWPRWSLKSMLTYLSLHLYVKLSNTVNTYCIVDLWKCIYI